MLSPQEAYEMLKKEYPNAVCHSVETSFPDPQYYHMGDYRIDGTQLEYWVDKNTGEVIKVNDMLTILDRYNAMLDTLSDPDDYLDNHKERAVFVKLIQPDGSVGDES